MGQGASVPVCNGVVCCDSRWYSSIFRSGGVNSLVGLLGDDQSSGWGNEALGWEECILGDSGRVFETHTVSCFFSIGECFIFYRRQMNTTRLGPSQPK